MDMSQWEVEFTFMEKPEAVMLIPADQPDKAVPLSGPTPLATTVHD